MENESVVYNPLNPIIRKNYGLGISSPYVNTEYDFSTASKQPELKKEEGLFSRLSSLVGGGSSSNDTEGKGVFGTVGSWFEPQGQSGASTAGNVLSGVGTAVNIGSGLAGMYYANKKAKLDKERAKMEKDVYQRGVQRDMENEARLQRLAANAGNGAFYK